MTTTVPLFRPFSSHFTKSTYWLAVVALLFLFILLLSVLQGFRQLPKADISLQQQNLNQQEILVLTGILAQKADNNFLQADLQNYIDVISKIAWVEQVDIQRDWKKGLIVHVTPRHAVAKFGSERLVDSNGVVFKPADQKEVDAKHWTQLQGDEKDVLSMMQQVKQVNDWYVPLGLQLKEVIVTSRMTWLFRFDNGLRILVNHDNTSEKLYRLSMMLQHQLNAKLPKMQSIDLRYKNGMAVTWVTPPQITRKSEKS